MEQIKERADNGTVIYFSECDYLYKDDSLIKGFKMIDAHDGDFVTLYEHPEIYVVNTDPKWAAGTKEFSGHKWRPCSSTCLTFLATLKSINKYPEMFLESKNDWGDCGLWENIGRTGGSTLWMSVPTLAFHCFSHNMPYTDWKDLYNSMVDKGKF
jgi:hypothetical protein